LQTEISLCRVYKRTGIDDGHGHPSVRSTPSRRATAQQDIKQASSSSTPTPPTTPSKMMQLLHGECTSAPTIRDQAAAHNDNKAAQRQLLTKPCDGSYLLSTASSAAGGSDQLQIGTAAMAAASSYDQSRNANAFASTYSLLSLVNAASMGGGSAAAAIDELSSLVGHGPPAYYNHHQSGGSFLPLPTPSSSQPMALGTLPMSLATISDKIWDWNTIPDAAARDYSSAGFK
jgi:hypothetical protein